MAYLLVKTNLKLTESLKQLEDFMTSHKSSTIGVVIESAIVAIWTFDQTFEHNGKTGSWHDSKHLLESMKATILALISTQEKEDACAISKADLKQRLKLLAIPKTYVRRITIQHPKPRYAKLSVRYMLNEMTGSMHNKLTYGSDVEKTLAEETISCLTELLRPTLSI